MKYYWDSHLLTFERVSSKEPASWYSHIHKRWYAYRLRVQPVHQPVPDLALILQGIPL